MRDDLKEKGRGNVGPARIGWICLSGHFQRYRSGMLWWVGGADACGGTIYNAFAVKSNEYVASLDRGQIKLGHSLS